jgi:hypothetical protein
VSPSCWSLSFWDLLDQPSYSWEEKASEDSPKGKPGFIYKEEKRQPDVFAPAKVSGFAGEYVVALCGRSPRC